MCLIYLFWEKKELEKKVEKNKKKIREKKGGR